MSLLLYIVGLVVFVAGLAWVATLLGVAQAYVTIGAAILLAIGLAGAAARALGKDPA